MLPEAPHSLPSPDDDHVTDVATDASNEGQAETPVEDATSSVGYDIHQYPKRANAGMHSNLQRLPRSVLQ